MELTDGEFRELVALCYAVCHNYDLTVRGSLSPKRQSLRGSLSPKRQSLLDKELIGIGIRPSNRAHGLSYPHPSWLDRIYVTEKGEAALKEEPIRALRTIESIGPFCKSCSNEAVCQRQGVKEIMSSLAPCQLPELLSHENTWMRSYAEERLRATRNEK